MNKKVALLAVALLMPTFMQGSAKSTRFVDTIPAWCKNVSNKGYNAVTGYFQDPKHAEYDTYYTQRSNRIDEIKNTDEQNTQREILCKSDKAFEAVHKPYLYLYPASRLLYLASGISLGVAGASKYVPQFHNEKVVYGAAATSVVSLFAGLGISYWHQKNFAAALQARKDADKAE